MGAEMRRFVLVLLILTGILTGCNTGNVVVSNIQDEACEAETRVPTDKEKQPRVIKEINLEQHESAENQSEQTVFDLSSIPSYTGSPYTVVNNNVPFFDESNLDEESYEYYSELDEKWRCGFCIACIGTDIMPVEERGEIGNVKPSGWKQNKYPEIVEGNYLYNRCHLIGYQLTGENDNTRNLITGTRYMNVEGMLPFENLVADYVVKTENHVLYRVTPVFVGDNLLASGVLLEAKSLEDGGEGIAFCVYCYNVQPGVIIDYSDGTNYLEKPVQIQ